MKKISLLVILSILIQPVFAQQKVELRQWMVTPPQEINLPAFAGIQTVAGDVFKASDLINTTQIDEQSLTWNSKKISNDSLLFTSTDKNNLFLLKSFLSVNRWTRGTLNLTLNSYYEVFLDGNPVKTKSSADLNQDKIDLELHRGNHEILIKVISSQEEVKLAADFEYDEEYKDCNATAGLNPQRFFTIHDVLEGNTVSSAKISPSGKYVLINYSETIHGSGKSKTYTEIYDLNNHQNLCVLRNKDISNVRWMPKTDRLSYVSNFEGKSEIFVYDPVSGKETSIVDGISDLSGFSWSPTEEYIIYSVYQKAEKPGDLKRVYGAEDRLPYFRNRSFLYKAEVGTKKITRLTAGNLSANLHDIKPDGSKILFSTSRMDYSEPPFSKQNLYEMDINSFELTTIWENKNYAGYCQYSPDGTRLLVQGGPECFGDIGVKVSDNRIPNSFDSQLYLYDLTSKRIDPVTRDFDPTIHSAEWISEDEIYLSVGEKDYIHLYRYTISSETFEKIDLEVEVLSDFDLAKDKPVAIYSGTSISTPQKLFSLNLKKEKSMLLSFPDKERYEDIRFGKTEPWNFVNKNGTTIYGRVYYPPDYDEQKKYPVIVNYYGGTSPIERSFGGRYPVNNWAANGYIVYVIQPSGATGFGQDFSALHVNGWGFEPIDDIIDGSKKFLESHPSADAENVGCIGASYGGYTTMLLQTRTDIFKTAISHAGISSLTSYWGEGYWGYTYNAGAAKNSYPWNRKDIYVENSPVYQADKFRNSILLLHGTDDTNVPVGESLQYYAALKLLGKEVEMVLVDGQNHWILDYHKRIQWHYTIISWFDYKLKGQPQQWNKLYPEKNL
ncbi:MAG: S9 family peptidase [Bacteroidales bacterium]|jgi:dipeptidyl aminopeptidase/acylaminoacyl peptidase|nr:S9 family peptidase [Bacteroidales bacterium]